MGREQTLWLLTATAAILIAEVIAGRHRQLYKRHDHLVNGLTLLIGMAFTRPLVAVIIAGGIGLLSPTQSRNVCRDIVSGGAACDRPCRRVFLLLGASPGASSQGIAALHLAVEAPSTHHSGKFMNVVLVYRVNPFWPFVMPLGWVTGFAIYAGQPAAAASAIFLFSMWGLVTHSNFRWDDALRSHPLAGSGFRMLEHLIVSPGVHHTHHGYGKDGASYRNFAILLSFYDWIFGTLQIPEGRPARYGLPGGNNAWAEEVLFPFYRARAKDPAATNDATIDALSEIIIAARSSRSE